MSFFSEPIDSTILNIFEVKHLSNSIRSWKISEILKKMMILKNDHQIVAIPILDSSV